MAYVIQEDILASVDETVNVTQGESQTYSINLYRDILGNPLTAERASSVTVSVIERTGRKVLMFANPQIPGVTLPLLVGQTRYETTGILTFEINEQSSRFLEPGDLNVIVSITYADFYPNSKTYILPVLNIGQIIEGAGGGTGGGCPTPDMLIMIDGGWAKAGDLNVGDMVFLNSSNYSSGAAICVSGSGKNAMVISNVVGKDNVINSNTLTIMDSHLLSTEDVYKYASSDMVYIFSLKSFKPVTVNSVVTPIVNVPIYPSDTSNVPYKFNGIRKY